MTAILVFYTDIQVAPYMESCLLASTMTTESGTVQSKSAGLGVEQKETQTVLYLVWVNVFFIDVKKRFLRFFYYFYKKTRFLIIFKNVFYFLVAKFFILLNLLKFY